ncbi:CHASE3 domain-containing protein [Oscillatoria sp. FACHB-1407]|uniref:sensor histidine kinase n=1 Tax=Oscillatoria sp. FACHB-1407 TaxID=2692847 RepID=UPI0016856184|nr:ATP-binding protein [Oscillatoria sp. FACHB-1407]MBD2465495.1 CHASE3 domain-containing protein [Oscillatoria sp. FACHB-1407]
MKWSLEGKWIAAGFGVVMVLTGGISFTSYQNSTRLAESANKVRQTHEVLETLIGILSVLNESEAGRRGYILFNDPSELDRYHQAIQTLTPRLDRLQKLTANDATQQQQLTILKALIAQRLILAQQSIQLHQQDPLARSAQTNRMIASTRNRQEIQKLVSAMQEQEEQTLERWVKQSQASIKLRMLLEFVGTFLTFLILSGIFALLYRQMIKRQQAEALQQKLAQEKELGELKLQFFSMVSHEFRTPLSSILGSAQILDETLQPLVEKQKLKSLYRIRSAAQLMTQLLSDILTLARAEAGKLEFNPKLVEMQTFCLNLLEDVQPLNKSQHKIQFTMQGQCTYAYVDERLLYSVLSNLISNAIKYSPNGGTVDFMLACETDVLTFKVRDEGIGIPQETQKILYEPFRRGENVGGILGTGLGLAVVKKCIDLHHGKISVESEVDMGTTFVVKIPQENIQS